MFVISNPVISDHLQRSIEEVVDTKFRLFWRPLPRNFHLAPFPEAEDSASHVERDVSASNCMVSDVVQDGPGPDFELRFYLRQLYKNLSVGESL